jgi:hypothetical protein
MSVGGGGIFRLVGGDGALGRGRVVGDRHLSFLGSPPGRGVQGRPSVHNNAVNTVNRDETHARIPTGHRVWGGGHLPVLEPGTSQLASHLPVLELRSCGTSQLAPTGARAPVLRNVATRTYRCSSSGPAERRNSHLPVLELRAFRPSFLETLRVSQAPDLRSVALPVSPTPLTRYPHGIRARCIHRVPARFKMF